MELDDQRRPGHDDRDHNLCRRGYQCRRRHYAQRHRQRGSNGPIGILTLSGHGAGTSAIDIDGNVTTSSGQVYNANIVLKASVTLADSRGNTIALMQAVDSDGRLDGSGNSPWSLTVETDGTTEILGPVGSAAPLAGLNVQGFSASNIGTTDMNGGGVVTSGTATPGQVVGQTYGNAVILTANTVLTDKSNHNITFNSTVDSQAAQNWSLTVNTAGNEVFNGLVGGFATLASLTTDANGPVGGQTLFNMTAPGTSNLAGVNAGTVIVNDAAAFHVAGSTQTNPSVETSGNQIYLGAVTVGANTTLTANSGTAAQLVKFGSTVTGGGNSLTVGTAGAGTVTNVEFDNTVSGLSTLAASGTTQIDTSGITSSGKQTYNGAVTLEVNTTLASTGSGDMTFSGTVDGGYGLTVDSSGVTTFTGAVGSGTALGSLSTDAGGTTRINGGIVTTTGAQTYGNAVTLGTDTTLTANSGTAAQLVKFGSTVTGGGNSLTVGTAGAGTVTNVEFDNTVSGLSTLAVSGTTQIDTASITSSGGQTYGGALTLGVNATLTANSGTSAQLVKFGSTVTGGGNSLTVGTAGASTVTNVEFDDTVSGLSTLAVSGTTAIDTAGITSSGGQTYTGAVKLGVNTTSTSTGSGNMTFSVTVDGGYGLTVDTAGVTTFTAAVGSGTALASLSTDADGTTQINGGIVTTTGAQTFGNAVTLGANTTLTANNGTASATGEVRLDRDRRRQRPGGRHGRCGHGNQRGVRQHGLGTEHARCQWHDSDRHRRHHQRRRPDLHWRGDVGGEHDADGQ